MEQIFKLYATGLFDAINLIHKQKVKEFAGLIKPEKQSGEMRRVCEQLTNNLKKLGEAADNIMALIPDMEKAMKIKRSN